MTGTCDCADTIQENDRVVTPDGMGTVTYLAEYEAGTQLDLPDGQGDPWEQKYKLESMHHLDCAESGYEA